MTADYTFRLRARTRHFTQLLTFFPTHFEYHSIDIALWNIHG